MKLENLVASTKEGGFGAINFRKRLKALKINIIALTCKTYYVEFWEQHLFKVQSAF